MVRFPSVAAAAALGWLTTANALAAPPLQPLVDIADVTGGIDHSCALATDGSVACWGGNGAGQLGDGSTTQRLIATRVTGLGPAIAVDAGDLATCAVTVSGAAYCWGSNSAGQLGTGTGARNMPALVSGLGSGVQSISAGSGHGCAVVAGAVKCWGANGQGQLGDGSTTNRATPVSVQGLSNSVDVLAAGEAHTCARTVAGGVQCWGDNAYGQLGNGSVSDSAVAADVAGLGNVVALSAGDWHTCALTAAGSVHCWGRNASLQLGASSTPLSYSTVPLAVGGVGAAVAISTGRAHSCAALSDGPAVCWGANGMGQQGNGDVYSYVAPGISTVGGLSGVHAIGAGASHTCAVADSGVACWGSGRGGQLGDGDTYSHWTPADVRGLTSGAVAIAAGDSSTCAVLASGGIRCWGANAEGTLGDGTLQRRLAPVPVSDIADAVSLTMRDLHTCARSRDGAVKCWGWNGRYQLGDGTIDSSALPRAVVGLDGDVTAVTVGAWHSCALRSSGALCWGDRYADDFSAHVRPTTVTGLQTGVSAISAGGFHTCALTSTGGIRCWGVGNYGQLGTGYEGNSTSPVQVAGLTSGAASVHAGFEHTCAILTTGSAMCWGKNRNGQLGDGTLSDRAQPVPVIGLNAALAIASGVNHTCALTTAGGVMCWGSNGYGELGDGTTISRRQPVQVAGLTSGVSAIAAGKAHTCALTMSGGVKCWGSSADGQIGDGTGNGVPFPVRVLTVPPHYVFGSGFE